MIYEKEFLQEISFPLGGIGTGCIGLTGSGRLADFEIFNRPAKGSDNGFSCFAVKVTQNGKSITKMLCGDVTKDLTGTYKKSKFTGFGFGPASTTGAGFPHFKDVSFKGEFPIAEITFRDEDFPGCVKLKAFNPFIPLDSFNSSIPCAIFTITYENDTDDKIDFSSFFTFRNPFASSLNIPFEVESVKGITLKNASADKNDHTYGDLSIVCSDNDAFYQNYWYRGGWCDGIVTFWNEISGSGLTKRSYDTKGHNDNCSVSSSAILKPGESKSTTYILSWNIPNRINYWSPYKDENGKDITWKNYYATVFADSTESAVYTLNNLKTLTCKTERYKEELFACTLDPAVIDAVSATSSVLKSPTVMRLENGEFYGFEGVHELEGSCEGTCQHVWNYAYALCFLFPDLEKSIRDVEEKYATDPDGKTHFRVMLPLGRENSKFRACLDGQMGSVIKIYREWKLSGDKTWLENKWETVVKILEYAWSESNPDAWDRNKDGVLEGRQHHTLDMELFGPSSWLQSFYLAALKAASEMALYLGHTAKADEYLDIFAKGKEWSDKNLFNGEYFIQKIDLSDKEIINRFSSSDITLNNVSTVDAYWNAEQKEIKYQIGEGCAIDQLCGQWHANLLGLGELFDNANVKTALKNLYKNNYKSTMRGFTNPWRIFALNDEASTIICSYPQGKYKPFIPIPYCEESMHGFEYQAGGLLISEGFVDEGLNVVRAVRARYNGSNRNPWNEIECGSNYSRSMASYALIPIFSGFKFDMPNKKIGFKPITKGDFRTVWSVSGAFGSYVQNESEINISLIFGDISLKELYLGKLQNKPKTVYIDGKAVSFKFKDGNITFDEALIKESINIIM